MSCGIPRESEEFKKSMNASFITNVPKKEEATRVKDYRPITLVESIYKIILRCFLTDLRSWKRLCHLLKMIL